MGRGFPTWSSGWPLLTSTGKGVEIAHTHPQDLPTLCPFQVDVYVMTQPLSGKWIHFGTEVTNSSGRLTFPVPSERALGIGVYPVRMVVR